MDSPELPKPPPPYRWGMLLCICLIALVVAGEAVCRLLPYLVPARVSVGQLDPATLYARIPGSSFLYRHREFENRITYNRFGLRGPEVTAGNPSNRLRVAFLGDSFTEALEVPYDKSWVSLVGEELGPGCETLDFGMGGYSAVQEVASYTARARRFLPAKVILQLYDNDWAENLNYRIRATYAIEQPAAGAARLKITPLPETLSFKTDAWLMRRSHLFMHLLVAWERFLHELIFREARLNDADRKAREDLVMMAALETAAADTAADGARLYLLLVPGVPEDRVRQINDFAVRHRVPLLDLGPYEADATRTGQKWHWQFDGHFNETGNREVAHLVAGWLR